MLGLVNVHSRIGFCAAGGLEGQIYCAVRGRTNLKYFRTHESMQIGFKVVFFLMFKIFLQNH